MTTQTCTAFIGNSLFASGSVAEVAHAIRRQPVGTMVLVFDNATGRAFDFDLRVDEVAAALSVAPVPEAEPRGPGRPKLGVVAREVTLLPRHWDWLANQPGGASITLRKLVEEARRVSGDKDRVRAAQEAAYNFMSAIAGNLPGFEEASRALFAYDRRKFADLTAAWPEDVRDFAVKLAFADLAKAS